MEPFADLHVHTWHSDGADSPEQVVARAAGLGVRALAITDHDTVSALAETRALCKLYGIEFLAGTEISASFRGGEVHVVGLGIDPESSVLADGLAAQLAARHERILRILEKLSRRGISMNLEDLCAGLPGMAPGRMHVAAALCERGHARTVQEGFDRYLNPGRPAYVAKKMVPVLEALSWIHAAGGLAFLAHPRVGQTVRRRLDALLALPFDGLEAYHSRHTPGDVTALAGLAETRGLLVAGGSDCHGAIKGAGPDMGRVRLPMPRYERIIERLASRA
jgi:predicted metal-dependent phosphoesterase TrpH